MSAGMRWQVDPDVAFELEGTRHVSASRESRRSADAVLLDALLRAMQDSPGPPGREPPEWTGCAQRATSLRAQGPTGRNKKGYKE